MKRCLDCGVEKEIEGFYKHSKMADGHLNKCIECVKARVKKHRSNNPEKLQAYEKQRSKSKKRIDQLKKYASSQKGKISHKRALQNYRERYPMKYAAQIMFGNAVKNGKITRVEECSECGSREKIEGHHDDYTKPLEVRWPYRDWETYFLS